MELTTGVHAFPQTIEQNGVENTITPAAIETPKGIVLVDVGYQGLSEQIENNLGEAGWGWDEVGAVLLTHQDQDHVGSLRDVVDRTGAVVYAHERCTPYVDGRKHPIKAPAGERYPPVDVDVDIVGGVSFRTRAGPMDVVFTPGHAPGHICLHFPDEHLLLAADALIAEDGLGGPKPQYTPEMDEALESAEKLADLEIERILCYHGGAIDADGSDIRELVDSLR